MKIDSRYWWLVLFSLGLMTFALGDFHNIFSFIVWKSIHIISASIFFGVIFTSSLIEWFIYKGNDLLFAEKYHFFMSSIDKKVITLSMTSLLISAIAMMGQQGYSLFVIQAWPWWTSSALINISLLGLFWAIIDVRSQKKLEFLFERASVNDISISDNSERDFETVLNRSSSIEEKLIVFKKLYLFRMRLNMLSNLWIIYIFYLMVFKPS